ncbi:MAG: XRE family transcriptional regulator, partial [Acidipropionibacterium jensenii]|nr:XRE family transcriptional regulator [Acidipropionibacterium jensenii]
LSEVERGQKEASSELILAICTALELPQSELMRTVSEKLLKAETKAERQVGAAA